MQSDQSERSNKYLNNSFTVNFVAIYTQILVIMPGFQAKIDGLLFE
jgi:hypothetical protein